VGLELSWGYITPKGEFMKKTITLIVLLICLAAMVHADVCIKSQVNVPGMMGQPAKNFVQEQWVGTDRSAMVMPEQTILIDMKAKKLIMVMHASKSYLELNMPIDFSSLMPEQMKAMMSSMMANVKVSVQPNGQTKKVLTYTAKGYDMTMNMMGMDMKMVQWASTDLPFDWKAYSAVAAEMMKISMRLDEKAMAEYKKIEGYPLASETNVMGVKITSDVTEISNKPAPASVYAVPAGYTKKDKLDMGEMK